MRVIPHWRFQWSVLGAASSLGRATAIPHPCRPPPVTPKPKMAIPINTTATSICMFRGSAPAIQIDASIIYRFRYPRIVKSIHPLLILYFDGWIFWVIYAWGNSSIHCFFSFVLWQRRSCFVGVISAEFSFGECLFFSLFIVQSICDFDIYIYIYWKEI